MINKIFSAVAALAAIFFSEAHADEHLIFELVIPFEIGGTITAARPDGSLYEIGRVVKLPTTTRHPSYTASAWAPASSIAATAVNALHMLVDVEDDRGRTMSIIPSETIAPAAGAGASIVVDSIAGTGIFGGWAPPVGTEVRVITPDGTSSPLSKKIPPIGSKLVMKVREYETPYMIEIENSEGGNVVAWYDRGGAKLIARVERPVSGCGRFEGTVFQDDGRIRANHSGVIDVDTYPRGPAGGFQIIPLEHARDSKELANVWNMTQYLIIAPIDGELKGTAPLFLRGLVPGTAKGEKLWDLWSTYLRRSLVLGRVNDGDWQRFPTAHGRVDDAFKDVTHIRIYFPRTTEPQK